MKRADNAARTKEKTVSILPEALIVAAKWWADCLRKTMKQDNGDPTGGSDFAMVMKGLLSARGRPTAEQANAYEQALLDRLRAEAVKADGLWLGMDYGPDMHLQEAAVISGLPHGALHCFPIKTNMRITSAQVTVSVGYGAQAQVIWSVSSADPATSAQAEVSA